jgi:hypothetical protein
MFTRSITKLARLAAVALLAVVGFSLAGSATGMAGADAKCRIISGRFTLEPVAGPECTSSVGICARGTYIGSLLGSSFFTGSSLIPTADTPTTSVVLLTGDNVFELRDGTLITKDAIVLKTTGAGEFAEIDTIILNTKARSAQSRLLLTGPDGLS